MEISKFDYSRFDEFLSKEAFDKLTPEEKALEEQYAQEYEEAYLIYVRTINLYEELIRLEICHERQALLKKMLDDLHEDNK